LDGIPPAPRGVPQVEVTFDIDASGILTVKAKDKATGKEQHITIQGSSNLSKDEVEKMRKEAESHAEEDRKRRETVEIRNQADTLISVSEKTLKDAGDKAKPEDRTAVETAVKELKEVKDKDDVEPIRTKMQALSDIIQKVGAAMYEQGQPAAGTPGETGTAAETGDGSKPASEQGAVDAEYKEVKE
jgi:molecular chaperone DnaK